MFSPSRLRTLIPLLFLLVALVVSPARGFAEAPVPKAPERQVEQSKTSESSGELIEADELERLQARDEDPGPDVVGGALTNQQLTYIAIALGAAVLVLIAK
jgi:hypothetical protein